MRRKFILKIMLISLAVLLIFATNAYCIEDTSTTRMKIDNSGAWNNITIGEAYLECEALNSTSSTLGTASLEAHLTTDYDYSAMAIFAVSQYGSTKTSGTTWGFMVNGNNTGIHIGNYNWGIYTTTVLPLFNDSTTAKFKGLFDEKGKLKKYIKRIDPTTGIEYDEAGNETGRKAIAYVSEEGTLNWYQAKTYVGTNVQYPIGVKNGLFGISIGNSVYGGFSKYGSSGAAGSEATFRPVIWN